MDEDVLAYLRDEISLDELNRRNDAAVNELASKRPYDCSNWSVACAIEGFLMERMYGYIDDLEFRASIQNLCFPAA